jgi:flagellar basal-body rod modification protein FlgD
MDYNAFLKLLIAQLKYQDPTKPTESTQFVAQLATFSQVEQSIGTNTKLDSLITSQAMSLADGVIGHTITSADGATSGVVQSVTITSEGATAKLANGDEVLLGSGVSIS